MVIAINTTGAVAEGIAISTFCDKQEDLRTCETKSPPSSEWAETAQAASVARVDAEPAARRLLIRLNSNCMWCTRTHQNPRDLCPPSLGLRKGVTHSTPPPCDKENCARSSQHFDPAIARERQRRVTCLVVLLKDMKVSPNTEKRLPQ